MPWLHSHVPFAFQQWKTLHVSTGTEMTKMRNRNIMVFMIQSNLAGMCFCLLLVNNTRSRQNWVTEIIAA